MKMLMQIAVVFGICLLGIVVTDLLPFSFPASVMSMIIMFMLLFTKILKVSSIEDFSGFLLNNMAFFFIPPGVELMETYTIISGKLLQFVAIIVVSLLITFFTAGYTVKIALVIQQKLCGGEMVE